MCSLKVRFSQLPDRRGVLGFALKAEVLHAVGMSKKIFVYHQSPAGVDGNMISEFEHIASPVDMHEIPEDAASNVVPWYRSDKCVVWFRSVEDLKLAKQMFVDDISALQRSYDLLTDDNNFSNQTVVDFDGGIYYEHAYTDAESQIENSEVGDHE